MLAYNVCSNNEKDNRMLIKIDDTIEFKPFPVRHNLVVKRKVLNVNPIQVEFDGWKDFPVEVGTIIKINERTDLN